MFRASSLPPHLGGFTRSTAGHSSVLRALHISIVAVSVLTLVPLENGIAQAGPWRFVVEQASVVDGEVEELSQINSIQVAPDGGVTFSQLTVPSVLWYSAAGKRVRAIGREGSGPGEFRWVTRHGWMGDTLWVIDNRLRRSSFLLAGQTLLRDVLWPRSLTRQGGQPLAGVQSPIPQIHLGDGTQILSVSYLPDTPPPEGFAPGSRYALVRADSSGRIQNVVASVGRPADDACRIRWRSGQSMGLIPVPHCPMTQVGLSPSGNWIAIAEQGGDLPAGHLRLMLRNSHGQLVSTRKLTRPVESISRDLAAAAVAALSRSLPDPPPTEALEAIRQMEVPTHYPPADRILVDDDGTIWIEYIRTGGDRRWAAVNALRSDLAHPVTLPQGYTLAAVRGAYSWGLHINDDGVPTLARLRRQ